MTDDRMLADLLGEAPPPDSRFRADVLALMAGRARRRAAFRRALKIALVFLAIGLAFPLLAAAELAVRDFSTLVAAFALMGLAFLLAVVSISGPRTVWVRSLSALRVSP